MSDSDIRPQTGLRRADWRFLLPCADGVFRHLVLLGGPPNLADHIIESGIACRVSLALPARRSADAVAIFCGAAAQLKEVADCLAPGGALYYEVDRRSLQHLAASPGRVQRWLRRAGLSPTGVYWAAPDFARCRKYVPLDSPAAFQWYLATLFVAGTPFHQLLEIGLRFFAGARGQRFAALAPCYAVTAIAGVAPGEAAPSVLGHPAFPAELKRPDMRPIVLTSGQDNGSRAVILPFAPESSQPTAIVKVSTHADFNRNTALEQATLTELRLRLQGDMRCTIPQPLGLLCYGAFAVSIESVAGGRPLLMTSGRWRASFQQQVDDLRLAANWLAEFHRQVQVKRLVWDEAAIEQWIETPLNAYAQTFGLTAGEQRLFAQVRQQARLLTGAVLPLIWMHYDFGPWNLYRSQQECIVIDWEFGRNWERDRRGPALYDLLYLVIYWNHLVRHLNSEAAELQGLYQLFVADDCVARGDKYSLVARQVIADYLAALDMDRRFLPLLLVYLWLEQALYQFARRRSLGGIQPDARAGNRSVRCLGVLAEHVEPLFASRNITTRAPVFR